MPSSLGAPRSRAVPGVVVGGAGLLADRSEECEHRGLGVRALR
jgi:hypothetical protein